MSSTTVRSLQDRFYPTVSMAINRRRHPVCLLAAALLAVLLAYPATSQIPESSTERDYGVVSLHGKRLFSIETSIGPISARSRAENINNILKRLEMDPRFVPALIDTHDNKTHAEIISGDTRIMTVTEGDANLAGVTYKKLADTYRGRIKEQLETKRRITHNAPEKLTTSFWQSGIATGALLACLLVLVLVTGRTRKMLESWRGKYIRTIRVQELELLREETIYALLAGMLRLTRTIAIWLLLFSYVVTVLGVFPQTEQYAYELKEQLWNFATNVVVPSVIGYAPNLFFLLAIAIVTRYALKFIKFLSTSMDSGTLKFPGFEPEWISPTANIIRFLVVVFAVMLAFPYLPGSGSPAFQQIAIFLGVLVSLGSTGAVAHLISGIFLTYTGAFKLNDRVKIADTVGDVVNKSLLATRVKTIKQEYITVPNGLVLGSHIINYSASGTDPGLILHTTITLGYDVSWRQATDILVSAAKATEGIQEEPSPFVLQTALSDFHVAYQLNAYTNSPSSMAQIYSDMHKNIQDAFNDAGIEILSPEYSCIRDGNPSTSIKPNK